MKKYIYTVVLIVTAFVQAGAQQGNGAYDFLNVANSARTMALGGAWVPFAERDLNIAANNPAVISDTLDGGMAISYVNYFSNMNFCTAQYAKSFDKIGSFVGTLQYHNYGKIAETSESGKEEGEFSAADYSVTLGWGRQLTERWSIGANLKLAVMQYDIYTGMALGVDLAALYRAENGWVYAATVRNIGGELFNTYQADNHTMPLRMQVGVAKKLDHVPFRLMLVYDNVQRWKMDNGVDETSTDLFGEEETNEGNVVKSFVSNFARHMIVGGELYLGRNLTVRGSFNVGRRYEMLVDTARGLAGFSIGTGIKVKRFTIDYTCSIQHIGGVANYVSLSSNLKYFK